MDDLNVLENAPFEEDVEIKVLPDGSRMKIFPDNSAVMIPLDGMQGLDLEVMPPRENVFSSNIAYFFDQSELNAIGHEIKRAVEEDFESKRPLIEATVATLKQIGYSLTHQGVTEGAPFKHSSDVFSPALLQTLLEITFTAYSSLFPPDEMVDTTMWGDPQEGMDERANHVKEWCNQYFTYQTPEYRPESRNILLFSATCGAGHAKTYIDPVLNMVVKRKVPIQNFVIHKDYSSQSGSMRKSHLDYITPHEFKIRQKIGYYLSDVGIPAGINSLTDMEGQDLVDEMAYIQGVNRTQEEEAKSNLICMAESQVYRYYPQDPLSRENEMISPYRIVFNKDTGEVAGIFRDWREKDEHRKQIQSINTWSFLPSFEGEGYGLAHSCGNLSRAATTMTRMMMDSALFECFPAFLYQQGISIESNNIRLAPGTGFPVPTAGGSLKDAIMKVPFEGPKESMFTLKKDLEDAIREFGGAMSSHFKDIPPTAPVATTMAALESAQKTPNAILQNWYEALGRDLEIFRECVYEWMEEGKRYDFTTANGNFFVSKEDFAGHIRLIPKGQPSMHNSSYKLLVAEMLFNFAKQMPQFHHMPALLSHLYKCLNIPEEQIQKFIINDEQNPPFSGDPVTETMMIMQGKPVTAQFDQDHKAHNIVHGQQAMNPNLPPEIQAQLRAHMQLHDAMDYFVQMQAQMGLELPTDPNQIPPEVQNKIAVMAAEAVMAQQQQQQEQIPPPLDPAAVALEEVKMSGEIASMKNQTDMLKLEVDREKYTREAELKEQELQQRGEMDLLRLELDTKKFELDVVTKERDNLSKELDRMNNEPTS